MKSRFVLLLLGAFFLLVQIGAAGEWVYFSEAPPFPGSKFKTSRCFLDKSSLRAIEPSVFEVYHLKEWDEKGEMRTVTQYWIDCRKMQISVGEEDTFIKETKLTGASFFEMGWFAPRDSGERQLVRIICPEK